MSGVSGSKPPRALDEPGEKGRAEKPAADTDQAGTSGAQRESPVPRERSPQLQPVSGAASPQRMATLSDDRLAGAGSSTRAQRDAPPSPIVRPVAAPSDDPFHLQSKASTSGMSWLLRFDDAEEEKQYMEEWARTFMPTFRYLAKFALALHVCMLCTMHTYGVSAGMLASEWMYLFINVMVIVGSSALQHNLKLWNLFFAGCLLFGYVGDAMPVMLDQSPPAAGPFGLLRFYSNIMILAVVVAGSSWLPAAVVGIVFSVGFIAAYLAGLVPLRVFAPQDYWVMIFYLFWSIMVCYYHEARIRQAWILARRLRKAAEAADAGLKAKSLFLSNCNHELRTPLHGIIGMTDLLMETELSEEQRDFLGTVRRCTDTLLAMVCDILDLEKAASGQLALEERPFQLRGVLEAVTDVLYHQAAGKGVDLACCLEEGLADAEVVGDRTRTQQVVMNLASNAVKFSSPQVAGEDTAGEAARPHGQVVIRAERAEGPDPGRPCIRVSVRDNGIGIDPSRMGALFRPFSQLDAGHTRKYGGTGLGLALVKSFLDQMGGAITVASAPGEGSTFAVTLPLPLAEGSELPVPEGRPLPGGACVRLRPWRASTREALEAALAAAGCAVDEGGAVLVTDSAEEAAAARFVGAHRRVIELLPPGAKTLAGGPGGPRLLLPVKLDALREALRASNSGRTSPAATGSPGGSRGSSPLPASPRPASPRGSPGATRSTRVLVAEDNAVNARLLSRMLARLGFEHDLVDDGQAAVDACCAREYGLLITDIQMPRKSGWDAAAEIRALQAAGGVAAGLRVVGCSANATREDQERSLEAGMVGHLSKPCRLEQLQALLDSLGLLADGK